MLQGFYCTACDNPVDEFLPGPRDRPNARCPHCQSLERHRFLSLLIDDLSPHIRTAELVLEFAPSQAIRRKMERYGPTRYVGLDIEGRFGPTVLGDITRLPVVDDSVDMLICYHVLEHIPDDATAIAELARVMSSSGIALVQVPRRTGHGTDEDPAASVEERIRRFGQDDHVRYYGDDFESRLYEGGLLPTVLWPAMMVSGEDIARYGLNRTEQVWVCRVREGDSHWAPAAAGGNAARIAALEGELSASRRQAARLLQERNDARARFDRIRNNPVISAAAAVSRPFRASPRPHGVALTPRRDPAVPVPSDKLMFMDLTEEAFLANGDRLLTEVTDFAGLRSDMDIFDVGSGYGRFAQTLLRSGLYTGTYHGFDILKPHVAWCNTHLATLGEGRVRFDHIDVASGRYNPNGTTTAEDVVFPFEGTADLMLIQSVFTHMYADGIRNYLSQFAAALRPNGRVLATLFLMNDSWREHEAQGLSRYPLPHELTLFCRYMSPDDPLHVIAYDEEWVLEEIDRAGLRVSDIILGAWCGRRFRPAFQDTVIMGPKRRRWISSRR